MGDSWNLTEQFGKAHVCACFVKLTKAMTREEIFHSAAMLSKISAQGLMHLSMLI